jgi:hypothetical protein
MYYGGASVVNYFDYNSSFVYLPFLTQSLSKIMNPPEPAAVKLLLC